MDVRKKLVDVFTHLGEHIRNGDEYGICYTSDFAEAVEEVLEMLKNSVTVQEWISVEDRLPEDYTYVVIWDGEDIGEAFWDGDIFVWSLDGNVAFATHWMPLPKPPDMRGEAGAT